ncbi:MAG: flavodoxin [Meiothermus sp.]|uniref:flavodoxin n=1 Tax=Meiothermus sp. TaxID=1955249 RepID=UPI0025D217F8|nr:flavodoxin [Meiothermus sp.]MCS7057941.1 flavodoxin [Meiothermus sp.]MCS7193667.1 flavodoxin [Meiothermus sp.]MCX7600983.1 flavodoxin [Meiothermus sp.]MDW8091305.1 flavodoxin [Meiothermus sp.]MDW8481566.1 flavodoxin [Meiothermus sp.]
MFRLGIFFGSTYGNTRDAAFEIAEEMRKHIAGEIWLHDVADRGLQRLGECDALLLGVSTWNIGELQDDWARCLEELGKVSLKGKRVALFGVGDQSSYPDSFQDALAILAQAVREAGGELVGFTSTDGYFHSQSLAVENGQFVGLALDYDNQPELSTPRIQAWVKQLLEEMALPQLARLEGGLA